MYTLAGASILDVAAEPEVVLAACRGIRRAEALRQPDWPVLPAPLVMVSVTLTGDRHTQIAVVELDGCIRCNVCTPVCPPESIINGDVEAPICTGCGLCVPVCPTEVIRLAPRETHPELAACWDAGARALEIHTGAAAAAEIRDWAPIAARWQNQGGLLSYSIDGQQLGYSRALALASELGRPGIIIQADGKPISGTVGDRSTIPALRLARAMVRQGNPAWVQPAGGTNDRTGPLANNYDVGISGVGMGSFARAVARELEGGVDTPRAWSTAYRAASGLVASIRPIPVLKGR
ncbi:MAG: hycB [Cyanobacteria bacterium RYN_339]|nr:hycB [Cyanobacteria bacterium RYN_339]